jgi:hypothetical protein
MEHDPSRVALAISIQRVADREYEVAIEAAKQALRSYPDHPWAHCAKPGGTADPVLNATQPVMAASRATMPPGRAAQERVERETGERQTKALADCQGPRWWDVGAKEGFGS